MDCGECRGLLAEYREDTLSEEMMRAVREHLDSCSSCSKEADLDSGLDSLVSEMKQVKPGTEPILKVKALYTQTPTQRRIEFGPVLDIQELAEFLRISVKDIEDNINEIPSFEFAGKIRFRRASIEEWIEKKESEFGIEKLQDEVDRILSSGL